MSYDTTVNTYNQKTFAGIISEMKSVEMTPIVLRWKKALHGTQNVYGFYGFKTYTGELLNGTVEVTGKIDENEICTFFPDELNVGYAIVPKCPRNMELLAATFNDNPPFTILSPDDVITEVKKMAETMKPASKKPVKKIEKTMEDSADQTLAQLMGADK